MQTPVVELTEEQEAPQCRHHWVIESPQGATSIGRCKVCDEVREFRNSTTDTLWTAPPSFVTCSVPPAPTLTEDGVMANSVRDTCVEAAAPVPAVVS